MDEKLKRLRERIEREVPFVGRKPYSHNIIGLTLNQIAGEFGIGCRALYGVASLVKEPSATSRTRRSSISSATGTSHTAGQLRFGSIF